MSLGDRRFYKLLSFPQFLNLFSLLNFTLVNSQGSLNTLFFGYVYDYHNL